MEELLQELRNFADATVRITEIETKIRRGKVEAATRKQRAAADRLCYLMQGRTLTDAEWVKVRTA